LRNSCASTTIRQDRIVATTLNWASLRKDRV
jgi:hypothetical protein